MKYDKNGNLIYYKAPNGLGIWQDYDENNNKIHYKTSGGYESWYKFEESKRIEITKKEFDYIKFKEEEKEYLTRDKYSRFEILDIR